MSGKEITGKLIVLGDCHFGVKRFNIDSLKNQLLFFEEQIFPYMEENNISTIFQLGDLFDNRTSVDIIFLDYLDKHFFKVLKEKNIILHTLIGNHDIAHRESREVSLVKFFQNMYPENFIVYEDREQILINNKETYVVPWIVKGEDLTYDEIKDNYNILGHFEIRHFAMVKGYKDSESKLTVEFFTKNTKVRNVFSGHYHLKDTKGLVKYLGTPWQLNWGDYEEEKGFYVWDGAEELEFIDNITSKKFVKVKYNDSKDNEDRSIEVAGLFNTAKIYNDEEFNTMLPHLKEHEVKFFINEAKDRHFDEVLYKMKEEGVKSTVIDNQEISKIIGTDYIEEENVNIDDTRTFIIETIKEKKPELVKIVSDILSEIDANTLGKNIE